MGWTCTTADHLTYACTFGSDLIEWAGIVAQAAWFVAGALLALSAVIAISTFFRRV